jgi:hypothetical protein
LLRKFRSDCNNNQFTRLWENKLKKNTIRYTQQLQLVHFNKQILQQNLNTINTSEPTMHQKIKNKYLTDYFQTIPPADPELIKKLSLNLFSTNKTSTRHKLKIVGIDYKQSNTVHKTKSLYRTRGTAPNTIVYKKYCKHRTEVDPTQRIDNQNGPTYANSQSHYMQDTKLQNTTKSKIQIPNIHQASTYTSRTKSQGKPHFEIICYGKHTNRTQNKDFTHTLHTIEKIPHTSMSLA